MRTRSSVLVLTQGDHLVHTEQLLPPFCQIQRIWYQLCAEMPIALLISSVRRTKYIIFMLQSSNRVVLYRSSRQNTELPTTYMLLRGMWQRKRTVNVLDMHLVAVDMAVVAIKRIRGLESMRIGILHAQVWMEDMVVVEEFESGLGYESMMS